MRHIKKFNETIKGFGDTKIDGERRRDYESKISTPSNSYFDHLDNVVTPLLKPLKEAISNGNEDESISIVNNLVDKSLLFYRRDIILRAAAEYNMKRLFSLLLKIGHELNSPVVVNLVPGSKELKRLKDWVESSDMKEYIDSVI